MFSSITSFTEGFKLLSLDALQDEEEDEKKVLDTGDGAPIASTRHRSQSQQPLSTLSALSEERAVTAPPPPTATAAPTTTVAAEAKTIKEVNDEWDWDDDGSETATKPGRRVRVGVHEQPAEQIVSKQRGDVLDRRETSANMNPIDSSNALGENPLPGNDFAGMKCVGADPQQRIDKAGSLAEFRDASYAVLRNAGLNDRVRKDCGACGAPFSDASNHITNPSAVLTSPGEASWCIRCREASASGTDNNDTRNATMPASEASNGKVDVSSCTSTSAEVSEHSDKAVEVPVDIATEVTRISHDCMAQELKGTAELSSRGIVEPSGASPVDASELVGVLNELAAARKQASALEGALGGSQAEVHALREQVLMGKDVEEQQTRNATLLRDDIEAARMAYRESSEAHRRSAERVAELERELIVTREAVDNLKAEKSVLLEQMNMAMEGRLELEAQLRQLHTGLTEGQEAARQEGRKEVERLEVRVKELLKDRDRKQTELELQNARRKETRDMARDLESQLTTVQRTAEEHEAELNQMKEEMISLKREATEAKGNEATWATKYEALDRNFKQVRVQGRNVDNEVDQLRQTIAQLRQTIAWLETEGAALAHKVEEEGAERVTVVSSISHERDFLLRQVDRLEKEISELRRKQDAEAAEAGARAQTTVVLEEYRARAQQALKRANEITSQTAAENKRLQVELAKLSAEVAKERPMWSKSKDMEEVRQEEVVELKRKLANVDTDRDAAVVSIASLQDRLTEDEEERRNTNASVMRLEAQGKSLKQELQRQQKALAAGQERESMLSAKLSEKDAALRALEEGPRQEPVTMPRETKSDTTSHTPSPRHADVSPRSALDDDKQEAGAEGIGAEAREIGWKDDGLQMTNQRFRSLSSEGESVDVSGGNVASQLVYVHQLQERMSKDQAEMRLLISELEASRAARDSQANIQTQLEKHLEAALLANKRLEELDKGRNAAINLEYLKNCVVGCLRTSEPSEHARLLPVITTILKLSKEEAEIIAKNITTRAQTEGSFGGSVPPPGFGGGGTRGWWSGKTSKR